MNPPCRASKTVVGLNLTIPVQATDTVQQSATRHGLNWYPPYDPTATYDNLEIRDASVPVAPPSVPETPSPADGATGVAVNPVLTWSAAGATSYDVALGPTSPPAPAVTGLTEASYQPALAASTTYYWQVTARNTGGTTLGPVWTFTTGAVASDLLVSDTFTGATGTLLTAHAPDVNVGGAPWSVTGETTGTGPTLSAGGVGLTAGSGHVQATLLTGAADVRLGVDYRVGGSTQPVAGLVVRMTDANNYLLLQFYQNTLRFYRRQAGAYTLLGSSAALGPVASGSTQRLEVRTAGSALTGWWNGMQVVQATDTVQQSATRHGLNWYPPYDPTATYDNLEIRD